MVLTLVVPPSPYCYIIINYVNRSIHFRGGIGGRSFRSSSVRTLFRVFFSDWLNSRMQWLLTDGPIFANRLLSSGTWA